MIQVHQFMSRYPPSLIWVSKVGYKEGNNCKWELQFYLYTAANVTSIDFRKANSSTSLPFYTMPKQCNSSPQKFPWKVSRWWKSSDKRAANFLVNFSHDLWFMIHDSCWNAPYTHVMYWYDEIKAACKSWVFIEYSSTWWRTLIH